MALHKVEFTKQLDDTLKRMKTGGLLLTSAGPDGAPNVMTLGWGNVGIVWGRPVFVVYVRPSRFTFQNIEATGEFTVNVPTEEMAQVCLACGQESGRDVDKFEKHHLTAEPAETVGPPLIAECTRHYECRIVHRNDVSDAALDPEIRADAYPRGDLHRVYYGQILRTAERA